MSKPHDCCYCGQPTSDQYREVTGWEKRRGGGGANAIIGRKETGRYACNLCINQMRHGITPGSEAMF